VKMGDVTIAGSLDSSLNLNLTAAITIKALDVNRSAVGFARLDWTKAVDLDGNGSFDVLNPGLDLPTPNPNLVIDLPANLQLRLIASVQGTAATNVFLTVGDVSLSGAATFAFVRRDANIDTDGNGSIDLTNATLDTFAFSIDQVGVNIPGVVSLTVTGDLGIARVTPAGTTAARYTALKLSRMIVSGGLDPSLNLSLSADLAVRNLNYNFAAVGFNRLDWTKAFDFDANGQPDLVDPGTNLDPPTNLVINFTSALSLQLGGSITNLNILDIITGSADFFLIPRTVDVDVNGGGMNQVSSTGDLRGAKLLTFILRVPSASAASQALRIGIDGVGVEVSSGEIAIASITPADAADPRRWITVRARNVAASLTGLSDITATLSQIAVDVNQAKNVNNPASVVSP
ncbi:MAG: hypothetical protein ACKOUR_07420, partial [Planctomycetota bacterium]